MFSKLVFMHQRELDAGGWAVPVAQEEDDEDDEEEGIPVRIAK